MAAIGAGIKRHRSEEYDQRQTHFIGRRNREIERWIVGGPLCPLHPVQHGTALGIGIELVAASDARIGGDPGEQSIEVHGVRGRDAGAAVKCRERCGRMKVPEDTWPQRR